MKLKIPEKTIEKQIIMYLWSRRILCTKIDSTGIYDPTRGKFRKHYDQFKRKGVSDIYAQYHGIPIWIEVKSATGRLSEEQKRWQEDVRADGGVAITAKSVDDVERCLAELDASLRDGA